MSEEDCKKCPFCGGEPAEIYTDGCYFVECLSCGAEGPVRNEKDLAKFLWNSRAKNEHVQKI